MKTLASLGAVVLLAVLLGSSPPASGAPEAGTGFAVSVDRTTLRSGQTLTATGRAGRPCAWIIDWNGERRSASGRRILATFVAPEVERRTRIPLRGTCFYATAQPSGSSAPGGRPAGASQRVTVTVPKSLNSVVVITVLPAGAVVSPPDPGGGGELPGTGGPDLWILLAGLATLLVGASLIRLRSPDDLPLGPISR